jgi:hypothetical protein
VKLSLDAYYNRLGVKPGLSRCDYSIFGKMAPKAPREKRRSIAPCGKVAAEAPMLKPYDLQVARLTRTALIIQNECVGFR